MMHSSREKVVKCRHCGHPHPYTEVRFTAVNDEGWWEIDCHSCKMRFVVPVTNPEESSAAYFIASRHDGRYEGDEAILATDIVQHNLKLNEIRHRFDYDAVPIHVCAATGQNLERAAHAALLAEAGGIQSAYGATINYGLAGRLPPYEHVVAHVGVPCACGQGHRATFYGKFAWNGRQQPVEELLLADVTGSDLPETLDGLFTKKEALDILHKLAIRWHLVMDRILVTVPFVGHQYLKPAQKLDAWEAILSILDPGKSVFVTRGASFNDYRKVLAEVEGLDQAELSRYGLGNQLIGANIRKQGFHAKVYAGLSEAGCEVFSGSANLVTGPSLENMSFRARSMASFQAKYLDRLNVKLPEAETRCPYFALIERRQDGTWASGQRQGPRLSA
ncbi:hypothetical protein ACUXK4_002841 [Methylorubrum extorquens]